MLLHLPPMDGHGVSARTKNGPALAGHGAEAVRDAIASQFTTLPEQLRRSLTWDQGAEMAQHAQIRDLNAVAAALNNRPRKTIGWRTLTEALNEQLLLLQATGVASTP
jgi:IS30 family transposase